MTLFALRPFKRRAKEKDCVSCSLLLCEESRLGCYPVVLGWRSLRFFRDTMMGFPQRSQNENSGKPIPATIASLSCLISFLQLSHFLTSIRREFVMISYGLRTVSSFLIRTA